MSAMGRLNASTEIIPIQGPSGRNDFRFRTNFRPRPQPRHQYFLDPHIVPRVKQYLEEHKDSVYVDIHSMVDELQRRYKEYARRKRNAFKQTVEKAFGVVLQQYGLANEYSFDEAGGQKSESSEEEVFSEDISLENSNAAAGLLTNMYMGRPGARRGMNGEEGDKELINISSDEEEGKSSKEGRDAKDAKDAKDGKDAKDVKEGQVKAATKAKLSIGPGLPPGITAVAAPPPLDLEVDLLPAKTYKPNMATSTPYPKGCNSAGQNAHSGPSTPAPGPSRFKKRKAHFGGGESPALKRKRDVPLLEPKVSFSDLGGIDSVLEEVSRLLVHMRHPEVYRQLGVPPPRGFLLHGPPGCGKTLLAHAIAGELGLPLLKVAAPELVAGVSGESEEHVRELFQQAVEMQPCVLFLDEVDAIAPHRVTAQREMERRIVAQLLACLDELGRGDEGAADVLVLGATNRPDALDPALRRAGRFDREVCLGIPDRRAREQILKVLCSPLRLAPGFDYKWAASQTPGFVGADLSSLTREAALSAISRAFADLENGIQSHSPNGSSPQSKEETKKPKNEGTVPDKKTDGGAEVIDLSDRDTPHSESEKKPDCTEEPSTSTSDAEKKTDKATDVVEEDEVCIEAEVTSSEAMDIEEVAHSEDADSTDAQDAQEVEVISETVHPTPLLSLQMPLSDAQLQKLFITQQDFEVALKRVQPSAKREGFATVPDVTWDDVGALQHIREELQMAILAPVQHPEAFEALGLTAPTGLLLVGPPGCGKTLLAKAVANEAGINFISVKGPELLNMYVGESEKAVRQCFQRARNSAPCVIFFDELDALCPRRSDGLEGSNASARVVNQMLTEMDGVEERRGVFLLAASNRPDIIDPAVLRPGRLDRILYVGLPDPQDRVDILKALTKGGTRPKLAADVDLEVLGSSSTLDSYTGADLAALVREAAIQALRELMISKEGLSGREASVSRRHLDAAIARIRPSVGTKDLRRYEELRRLYAAPLSRNTGSRASNTSSDSAKAELQKNDNPPTEDKVPATAPADDAAAASVKD